MRLITDCGAVKGADVYYCHPGEHASFACRVCGAECAVERDVLCYGGFAVAMARLKSRHDVFTCPHSGRPEHKVARSLVERLEQARMGEEESRMVQADLQRARAVLHKPV
jgi:hypothetical protein